MDLFGEPITVAVDPGATQTLATLAQTLAQLGKVAQGQDVSLLAMASGMRTLIDEVKGLRGEMHPEDLSEFAEAVEDAGDKTEESAEKSRSLREVLTDLADSYNEITGAVGDFAASSARSTGSRSSRPRRRSSTPRAGTSASTSTPLPRAPGGM
jgi:methyl-accepting chemotaxis protein